MHSKLFPVAKTQLRKAHTFCHHYFPFLETPTQEDCKENHVHSSHCKHSHHQPSKHSYSQSATPQHQHQGDYAFEATAVAFKFGRGVLQEVGFDAVQRFHLKHKRVVLFTDKNIRETQGFETVKLALEKQQIQVIIYDETEVEPTDKSFKEATRFFNEVKPEGVISLGGGSVMDTAKAANLYYRYPTDDFLDYVNPPIGKGKTVPGPLLPHIACPTTCGTGAECTGYAIFDLLSLGAKTGINSPLLRPNYAIIDPLTTLTLPANVVAASGFDVLSHGLESYTARPFTLRKNKFIIGSGLRPQNQGQNPYGDFGCLEALRLTGENIVRAVNDPTDIEARENMLLASTIAGTAIGNVGVHLPHGMSYAVSGLIENFRMEGYPKDHDLVPHGVSVILNAPSVFQYTAKRFSPHRHLQAAAALGADIRDARPEDAGEILHAKLLEFMKATKMPSGLSSIGYTSKDIKELVKRTVPQKRVIDNAPFDVSEEDLSAMFQNAMQYW